MTSLGEFDDQLHIKLKVMKEEQQRKLLKSHVRMKTLAVHTQSSRPHQIGIVKDMQLEIEKYVSLILHGLVKKRY